ncbi:TonB-dependent receptor [Sediminicola arcticus]|jgi:iron complex outermembrane receptor protein|uniref:TonB-dependent receptor n=1 Tax=Sediminicola arcticus TaxID=1574308 RepID=A0ABV2SW62_9FLAO
MHNFFLVLLVVIFFSSQSSFAQNSISGTITGNEDQTPLEQVEIYFPQLEKGTLTNEKGIYSLSNIPVGPYKIVITYLGFQTFSKTLDIKQGENVLDVSLKLSAIEMEEVIVSTPFHKLQSENVVRVEYANVALLRKKGAMTLADGITNIAGVESVSTGIGIGKPVIRGLSSNRVLVYTQGVRLENQQFGDEHGLGVNDAGIESIEVIKGPASLLYGSDAMGGVLYLNPEKFAPSSSTEGDINLNYYSNTEGYNMNAGFKTSAENLKFILRGGTTSHVDYKTGDGDRVTNSRFKENDLKTGLAYQTTKFNTELRYNYNATEIGIPEEIGEQTKERTPELPFQKITNQILSSKSNLFFDRSSLEFTLGYILNDRKEFEDDPSNAALDMNLSTFNYNIHYNLPKVGKVETIFGLQGMHQNNTNFGEEILIPNALTNDIGALATSHIHFNDNNDIQLGLRYDHRSINSEATGILGEQDYIDQLNRNFSSFNAAAGYKLNFAKSFIGRLNLATGFRAPNLAELTSNGVHEGTNRYEIGNPDLKNEQNLQTDISLEFKNEHIEFYANGFLNDVNNYVFLEPTGTFQEDNAVFNYEQQDAQLYGGEFGFHLHPHPLDWLHLESSYQTVIGKLDGGDYLPLIPANSLTNTIRVEQSSAIDWLNSGYAFVTLRSVFNQNKVNAFETFTDGYNILNIGIGGSMILFKQDVEIRISGNNILDKSYVSHLSRLKPDGINDIGRNISLGLSLPL